MHFDPTIKFPSFREQEKTYKRRISKVPKLEEASARNQLASFFMNDKYCSSGTEETALKISMVRSFPYKEEEHYNAVIYLLSLVNVIFSQNTYPPSWQIAIILPFLKPNTDPTLPVSYRPIALTSVLGKLFQKILNRRLFWYLVSNNHLSPNQCGFREGRNTTHALANLQTQINNAFDSNCCLYSIFFDSQKAFPRLWRHYICTQLRGIGLRGGIYQKCYNLS